MLDHLEDREAERVVDEHLELIELFAVVRPDAPAPHVAQELGDVVAAQMERFAGEQSCSTIDFGIGSTLEPNGTR